MAGRTGVYDPKTETWSNVINMPCTQENNFTPALPEKTPDLIYLCYPNNPTGSVITKDELQKWVDYANEKGSVIIYDAAYEAYISEENIPHSIYECDGARTCAIELRSFSKNAGFTGMRLGFTVIPKELMCDGVALNPLWARRHVIINLCLKLSLSLRSVNCLSCTLNDLNRFKERRLQCIRRRKCTIHLVKDTRRHDKLAVL